VLLVDADPSGSALEWSDFAAMDPRLPPQAAFPLRIVALPSRNLHRRVPGVARPDDVVIIDAPQLEDHAGMARSALRYADEILIPCAPSHIDINRTTPVRDEITDVGAARDQAARTAVLLNRASCGRTRPAMPGRRWRASAMTCSPIPVRGRGVWGRVARDLAGRCVPLRSAASLPGRRSSAKRGSPPRRSILQGCHAPAAHGRCCSLTA
jgi:hypothetical protein